MRLKIFSFRTTVFLACVLLFAVNVFPQASKTATIAKQSTAAEVENHKLDSRLMNREMPYRVILPVGYPALKQRTPDGYPVIYLLHGLTGHFDNWTDRAMLAEYASAYKMIIVTPEGDNGWYTDNATISKDKYESYIVKELIPEIDKKFRTAPMREKRAIAGLSMGGFGAVKFGLKYPELFSLAGSFSGALYASSYRSENDLPPGNIRASLIAIFGEAGSETQKANNVFAIVRDAVPEKIKAIPFLYIDCGTEDFLFQNNRDFVSLLVEKKIPHEFRQLPGAHNWQYWDSQVQEFLRLANKSFYGKNAIVR